MSASSATETDAAPTRTGILVDLDLARRDYLVSRLAPYCRVPAVATVTEALERSGCTSLVIVHDPPGIDVVHAVKAARCHSRIPIIAMCPVPVSCEVKLRMFAVGVDDIVPVNVDPRELVARVAAVGRRVQVVAAAADAAVTVGSLRLDPASLTAAVGGTQRRLTRKEFDLLKMLAGAAGRTVRRDDIARRVWRRSPDGLDHTIDSHIASLRTKLGLRSVISTVRGVGYRIDGEQTRS